MAVEAVRRCGPRRLDPLLRRAGAAPPTAWRRGLGHEHEDDRPRLRRLRDRVGAGHRRGGPRARRSPLPRPEDGASPRAGGARVGHMAQRRIDGGRARKGQDQGRPGVGDESDRLGGPRLHAVHERRGQNGLRQWQPGAVRTRRIPPHGAGRVGKRAIVCALRDHRRAQRLHVSGGAGGRVYDFLHPRLVGLRLLGRLRRQLHLVVRHGPFERAHRGRAAAGVAHRLEGDLRLVPRAEGARLPAVGVLLPRHLLAGLLGGTNLPGVRSIPHHDPRGPVERRPQGLAGGPRPDHLRSLRHGPLCGRPRQRDAHLLGVPCAGGLCRLHLHCVALLQHLHLLLGPLPGAPRGAGLLLLPQRSGQLRNKFHGGPLRDHVDRHHLPGQLHGAGQLLLPGN
mmetsp:Transcript_27206/g.78873  ORF Transcript_27206/g.78873 Transcript_27206/m.78873 type:complete len:395 (-) Transcript_27206:447-1631(-)